MFDLTGRVALVTGAMRGMGKAHAIALARQGAHVAATDVSETACEMVAAEIRKAGGTARAYRLDVTDESQVDTVFGDVIAKMGSLDILVNNAGIYAPKPALELTAAEWDRTLSVNLKGQFLCARRAAQAMKSRKWGRIINIASIASGQVGVGIAGGAHYTASKGGVLGLTETLAVEWAPFGITVNAVAPGAIDTPMVQEGGMTRAQTEALLAGIPLRRMGTPEEVAAAVVFLASAEAGYVTGSMLVVDGGWLAA